MKRKEAAPHRGHSAAGVRQVRGAERLELGCAGHFICASDCHWRRHTQVGLYRISSVGELYYKHEPQKRQTLGADPKSFFETMVFETTGKPASDNDGCGCQAVKEWREVDGQRYATAGAAQRGHEAFVAKYMKRTKEQSNG